MIKKVRENKITHNKDSLPALFYFPQWQGTGMKNNVQVGAETLYHFFDHMTPTIIPLSDKPLNAKHKIIAYEPLVTQLIEAQKILNQKRPDRLVLIAGDCAAEVAPIEYFNKRYEGDLTLIWFDAHADLNTPDSSPSGHFHGMALRLLLDGQFSGLSICKRIYKQQVILAGVRDLDVSEETYIDQNSITVSDCDPVGEKQLLELLVQQNAENIYVHLDLDILEPAIFPWLQCPAPNGLLPENIAELIEQLIKDYNVVGLSLTETTAENQEDLQPIKSILNIYRKYLLG